MFQFKLKNRQNSSKNRLSAGLSPDPIVELKALPHTLSWAKKEGRAGQGKENSISTPVVGAR